MSRLSRAAWLYMAVVVTVQRSLPRLPGAMHAAMAGTAHPAPAISWWVTLGVLMALFMICDSTPTTLTSRQSAWSPSSAATLAAVVLLGPGGAALVGATSLISLRRGGAARAGL